jgi:copper chaperone NosL
MKTGFFFLFVGFAFWTCAVEPAAINYGVDQCYGCRMIISDQRFGVELVTTKGKVFKFDAIECMIPEVQRQGGDHYAFILATDYAESSKLIEAESLNFLQSPEIPSPMGRNLSAHKEPFQSSNTDAKWYKWIDLVESFSK